MKLRLLSFACGIALCGAASAVTVITPLPTGNANEWSAQFSGSGTSNSFTLDLSTGFAGGLDLTALLSANLILGSGYNITSASFDGISFVPVNNYSAPNVSTDLWTYGPGVVTAALHTLVVNGVSGNGGSFTGSVGISATPILPPPVPEPETFALFLAGLGVLGFMAKRRQQG